MLKSQESCSRKACILLDYSFTELAFRTCYYLDERSRWFSSSLQVERDKLSNVNTDFQYSWIGTVEVEEVLVEAKLQFNCPCLGAQMHLVCASGGSVHSLVPVVTVQKA